MTLRADADEVEEKKGILLITLHAAKGLEFDEVFLAGFEDGSLPHASSKDDDDELEEERRLAYVGMTRAKDRLTLSYVLRRMVRGEWMSREPSPFLEAIPERVLVREDLTSGFGRGRPGIFLEREEGATRRDRRAFFIRPGGRRALPGLRERVAGGVLVVVFVAAGAGAQPPRLRPPRHEAHAAAAHGLRLPARCAIRSTAPASS